MKAIITIQQYWKNKIYEDRQKENEFGTNFILKKIPSELRTEEICMLACENNGWNLKFVPAHLKSNKLCEVAVCNDKNIVWDYVDNSVLQFVPWNLRKLKLCALACSINAWSILSVPEYLLIKSIELYRVAYETDIFVSQVLPECVVRILKKGDTNGDSD